MIERRRTRGRSREYFSEIARRLGRLSRQPAFRAVTIFGNGLVLLGATAFHWAESARNPAVGNFVDSLFWAVSTVTTVGYGNLVPVTIAGKAVGIGLMILGTLFLWSYMALFVGAIISPDLSKLETELRELERDLSQLQKIAGDPHGRRDA